ncbi:putative monooxygenase [Didymella exigua CBS 183.55]|uniref:Putative monooxygenase n=1 Tax=Didymella exigua CBS 183.55 TaxID=1150837 RepID=A0A6A5RX67_9PLEO|nr:putative monooxygenase [Didymella exigua CBS 183.55]KAF1931940.1 putative monooxygenase [Didymella exigua CBS 183.55]
METTDVIICGCGPTGAMLSVLLGQHSVPNVVLEREAFVNRDPRGIALDEDGIRCLQACGIYDKVFTDIGQCMGRFRFVGGTHNDLMTKPFMVMDYNTTEGGTGHPGFVCHKQPAIEKHLRSRIEDLADSQLRLTATVTSISEDEDWVYVTYTDASGQERRMRAKFLVGADGKTGYTRKKYLEPKGVFMEKVSQMSYEETWVALNWKITPPTPESHPDFPLWKKGYTPEMVYDAFFPSDFRFLCNPKRAAVCGRFGLNEDRLWRFEFVVLPGEDGNVMAGPDKIREIVYPYITHTGRKYGLDSEEIQFPSGCIEVLRSRPFNFSARSCNKWALNRVILCGDAAHVFPPFGGQGIASGFRDAISLVWRLVLATRQPSQEAQEFCRALFEGWYTERKQQLDKSLASTIENGSYVTQADPVKIFFRDWYLWSIQLVPTWKRQLEQGSRRGGMTQYSWEAGKGMAFLAHMAGGFDFPQVYCVNLNDEQGSQSVQFTDDVIFAPGKKGFFQMVVFLNSVSDLQKAQKTMEGLEDAWEGVLRLDEATYLVGDTDHPPASIQGTNIYRLATGQEFAAHPVLCAGRPDPQYYDPSRIMRDSRNKQFVILRPDRFVFAACDNRSELREAAAGLSSIRL